MLLLNSLHIKNFRAFDEADISFAGQLTVICGINGSGKTSLLHAILCVLSPLVLRLRNGPFLDLSLKDTKLQRVDHDGRVRFEHKFPSLCSAKFSWNGSELQFSQERQSEGSSTLPHYSSISVPANLPVIVFYRADRKWNDYGQLSEQQAAQSKDSRLKGYDHFENASVDQTAFQDWIISKSLERLQTAVTSGRQLNDITDDELGILNQTLRLALPDEFVSLSYDIITKDIVVELNKDSKKTVLSFNTLSDGERTLICLIADICRRICLLNPQLGKDAIKHTDGIVLIDEIDIHLHPAWQRKIITGLRSGFPNLQFIVTTHSPQVLGEVHPKNILLLREGRLPEAPSLSYGLTSNEILRNVMNSEDQSLQVSQRISQILNLAETEQYGEAQSRLEKLRADIGGSTEEMEQLHTMISTLSQLQD